MEIKSGGSYERLLFILGLVVITSTSCEAGPIDETNANYSVCNTGWELCPTTNLCVLSVCKDIDYTTVSYNRLLCGHDQVPCEAAGGACMWPCPKPSSLINPSSPLKPSCGIGKVLCESTMTCTTQEQCDKDEIGTMPSCLYGTTFCLTKGGCVLGNCDEPPYNTLGFSPLKSCPFGKEFCLDQERCVPKGKCHEAKSISAPFEAFCQPWEEFCLGTGGCVLRGICHNRDPTSSVIDCPLEEVFCLETQSCLPESECGRPRPQALPLSPMCPMHHVFCLQVGGCVLEGTCGELPEPLETAASTACPTGHIFCMERDSCVPLGMCGKPEDQTAPLTDCSLGQIYCLESYSCVPLGTCGNPKSQTTEPSSVCPPGELFCMDRNSCMPTCEEAEGQTSDPSSLCPYGQLFCMEVNSCVPLGACEESEDQKLTTQLVCPTGQIFCTESDSCMPFSMCGQPGTQTVEDVTVCPPGAIFCLERNSCMTPNECGTSTSSEQPLLSECPLGKILCLSTGECEYPGQCKEERDQKAPLISCSHDEVFCMDTGACVPLGQCGTVGSSDQAIIICPQGKVFCAVSGTCELAAMCGGVGSPGIGVGSLTTEVCPPDKVFCLASGTCEIAGSCGGRPREKMATMCPRGYIYCLQKGECVSARKGCDSKPDNIINCPPGTVLSIQKGNCVPDFGDGSEIQDWLPDLKCPNVSSSNLIERVAFTHSTCISNHHCPYGYSCCPDPETLHLQCVNSDGIVSQNSLESTCMVVGEDRHDTRIACDAPEDCPVASVCCQGSCRSLKGVDTCPPRTLYCSRNQSCLRVGEVCEEVCQPGAVVCTTADGCESPDNCEFVISTGAPWTVPNLLILPGGDEPLEVDEAGVLFEDVYKTAEKVSTGSSEKSFGVLNVTGRYGTWYYRQVPTDSWQAIDNATTLTTSGFLRYLPTEGTYGFGYDYLTLREKDTDVTRNVVQLIAPEDPKMSLTVLRPKLTTQEEVWQKFYLYELIDISFADDLYWSAWWNGVDLPREANEEGVLDYAHPAVLSWVSLLTRPGYQEGGTGSGSAGGVGGTQGVRIALETPTSLDETTAIIAHTVDLGENWSVMNPLQSADIPVSSLEDLRTIQVQFIPALNAWGNVSYVVSAFSSDDAANPAASLTEISNLQKIVLEIQPVNDAPSPIENADLTQLPALNLETLNEGYTVEVYASIFYRDVDEGSIGLALLQAYGGALGKWQYSLDNGNTYIDILDLADDPLPRVKVSPTHQGLVDIESIQKRQECNVRDLIKNGNMLASQSEEGSGSTCMDAARRRLGQTPAAADEVTPDVEEDAVIFDPSNPQEKEGGAGGGSGGGGGGNPPGSRPEKQTREKRNAHFAYMNSKHVAISHHSLERYKRDSIQSQFEFNGPGNLNVSTVYPTVEALCLPSAALLRFKPVNDSSWDRAAARSETRLMFTAWDMSELTPGSNEALKMNISLQYCQAVGTCGNGSIAWSPAVVSAEWSDCSGNKVISGKAKVTDACGICGGDGTTCLDCAGVLNGTATYECDQCVGGTTGKEVVRDCNNQCGDLNYIDETGMCMPRANPNITSCDGQKGSMAVINQCGVCIGGTTGLDINHGVDECGVCGDKNECFGCDGKPNSGTVIDLCGICLQEDDPNANDCEAMGRVEPRVLDASITSLIKNSNGMSADLKAQLTVKAQVAGVSPQKYKPDNCTLEGGKISLASHVTYRNGMVKAAFPVLTQGEFTFSCLFVPKKKKNSRQTISLQANETVLVVDSSQMAISLPSGLTEVETTEDTEVKVTVTEGKVTDDVKCFLLFMKEKGQGKGGKAPWTVKELDTEVTGENEVTCTIPADTRPGTVELGLAQTPTVLKMLKKSDLKVTTVQLTVKATAPEIISAILDPLGEALEITFDQNVESDAKCKDIFNWPWANRKKLPVPKCRFRAATLDIQLGSGVDVSNGTELELTDANGIRRKQGTPETAPQASGSVKVFQPEASNEIKFQLDGDTQACNTSDVKAIVSRIQGAKVEDVTISWNITWEPGTTNWSQSETLEMWESVREITQEMKEKKTKAGGILTFPGKLLKPGKEYMYVAKLEAPGGLMSEPQGISVSTLPPDKALIVTIRGPSETYADRVNKYKTVTSLCSEGESVKDLNLQYMWDIQPEGANWKDNEGRKVKLRKGVLRGGHTYTLTVEATDFGKPPMTGDGMLEITTISQGIEVMTAADTLKVGSSSSIKLDASDSRDMDNNPGDINFRWSCLTAEGEGCFRLDKDGNLQRLESSIGEDKLTSSELLIAPGMIQPGRYVFTVEATKKEASASKDVNVEVSPGELPIIVTQRAGMVVDAQERIIIKGWVTGQENMDVWWESIEESGFENVDISQMPSGETKTLKRFSVSREYDLVLPRPGLDSWRGLDDGANYKFRLTGRNQDGNFSFSEVDVRTNKRPTEGTFEVSQTEGDALVTKFTFSASEWSDDPQDLPLETTFGYYISQGLGGQDSPITWTAPITDEEPTATLVLVADEPTSTVIPVVKVCDIYKGCTTKEGDPITVKLPDSLPQEALKDLSDNFENLMRDDESADVALNTMRAQLATLEALGGDDARVALIMLAEEAMRAKTDDMINKMNDDEGAVDTAVNFLTGAVNLIADIPVSKDTMNDLLSVNGKVVTHASGAPEKKYNDEAFARTRVAPESTSDDDRIFYPATDEDQNNVRGGKGKARKKRQAADASVANTSEPEKLTLKQVITTLKVEETAFADADPQSSKTAQMAKLVDFLNTYLSGICLDMSFQDNPRDVLGTFMAFRVVKSQLDFPDDTKFTIANVTGNDDDFITHESKVMWGPILENYKEWPCGQKGSEGEERLCYGACLGTAMLKEDYLSPVAGTNPPGEIRGNVAKTALINSVTGVEIPVDKSQDKITYNLAVDDIAVPDGKVLKCFGWNGNEWEGKLCASGNPFTNKKGISKIRCFCGKPGYVAAFVVDEPPATTPPPETTEAPEVTTTASVITTDAPTESMTTAKVNPPTLPTTLASTSRNIKFKINADYNKTVGNNKEAFEDTLTKQIANRLGSKVSNIRNLTVSPGSILVQFDLVQDNTRVLGGSTPDELYEKLSELIGGGNLKLKDLQNGELNVPPQDLDGSYVFTKESQNMLPIVIGSVVGVIVLIVIVLICVAVYLKNKKRMDKIQPLQLTGTQQPTYSSIHFEQSLDGTASSLVKNRNNQSPANRSLSSGGTYSDEGIFIERRSTASSRVGSSGASSVDSGNGQEVPDAFKYESPTKEQMERSGPIPEHILQKIKDEEEEALPGTPGGLA